MTRVAIGLGCRKNTQPEVIVGLVRDALARLPRPPDRASLFSSARKTDEACLHEAARRLGFDIAFLPDAELAAVDGRLVTRSAKVREHTGLDSVAEAAALAGGGARARIVVPRITRDGAACAIAAEMEETS